MSIINSLIQAAITATASPNPILPYSNLLPIGRYSSEIISVADAMKYDTVIGIDCVHKLTNLEGKTFLVKFRFFAPHDTENLIKTLQAYGLTGSVGDVLTGLKEEVEITQRPGSNLYVYIAQRSLVADYPATKESHTPKKVGLSGRLSRRPSSVQSENIKKFFDDEEDEDFEDFLEDD